MERAFFYHRSVLNGTKLCDNHKKYGNSAVKISTAVLCRWICNNSGGKLSRNRMIHDAGGEIAITIQVCDTDPVA